MISEPDVRLLRRATLAVAAQVATAVAATLVVVGALAFWLIIRAEHVDEERTVRTVTKAAGTDLIGTDGVMLVRRSVNGVVGTSPGTPPAVEHIDLSELNPGRGNADAGRRHFEVYVVDGADNSRTAGFLDVTVREEAGERLAGTLLFAGVTGIVLAAGAGAVLGRRVARPLARALAMQRRFVADASHELRTPLAVLHTRAQLIQRRLGRIRTTVDDQLTSDAAQLTADTRALAEVVEDLLLSAELQHRRAPSVELDTAALVRELADSVRGYAEAQGVTLSADVGRGDLVVRGVRSSLRRALAALVDNALAHVSAGGQVTIGAHRRGAIVGLAVADNGDGLDPADTARLLERFARGAHRDDDRPGRRFGLGLALVQEVVDGHDGRLVIDGRPGHGARFTIELPAGQHQRPHVVMRTALPEG